MKVKAKEINVKMAEHLKTLRLGDRYTMRQLAGVLGTPHSFIGKIEQQGRRLDVGEFILYCRAMGKDPVAELKTIVSL
jgi:hypothetical protein